MQIDEVRAEFGRGNLPCPEPSKEAVLAGVFGFDENGVVVPSLEDVRAMTEEHARELVCILLEQNHLSQCASLGMDPASGKVPLNPTRRAKLLERLSREAEKLKQHYEDALAAYGDGFGWEAALALDEFVKENCQAATQPRPPPMQKELF